MTQLEVKGVIRSCSIRDPASRERECILTFDIVGNIASHVTSAPQMV